MEDKNRTGKTFLWCLSSTLLESYYICHFPVTRSFQDYWIMTSLTRRTSYVFLLSLSSALFPDVLSEGAFFNSTFTCPTVKSRIPDWVLLWRLTPFSLFHTTCTRLRDITSERTRQSLFHSWHLNVDAYLRSLCSLFVVRVAGDLQLFLRNERRTSYLRAHKGTLQIIYTKLSHRNDMLWWRITVASHSNSLVNTSSRQRYYRFHLATFPSLPDPIQVVAYKSS